MSEKLRLEMIHLHIVIFELPMPYRYRNLLEVQKVTVLGTPARDYRENERHIEDCTWHPRYQGPEGSRQEDTEFKGLKRAIDQSKAYGNAAARALSLKSQHGMA